MKFLKIPIQIENGRLVSEQSIKDAIDASLHTLITTAKHSGIADMDYGFVFNNLSFENFNENEGVVYNAEMTRPTVAEMTGLYEKKISGTSKNLNTFAAELQGVIEVYEPRLKDVTVSMTYIREEKNIYVTVKGTTARNNEPYQFINIIRIWK